jgi:hypothetical protein
MGKTVPRFRVQEDRLEIDCGDCGASVSIEYLGWDQLSPVLRVKCNSCECEEAEWKLNPCQWEGLSPHSFSL